MSQEQRPHLVINKSSRVLVLEGNLIFSYATDTLLRVSLESKRQFNLHKYMQQDIYVVVLHFLLLLGDRRKDQTWKLIGSQG